METFTRAISTHFLARFLFRASPLDGICASLPHCSPTLPQGLYHMPVAGVRAGLSGAASHSTGKTRTDTHTGRKKCHDLHFPRNYNSTTTQADGILFNFFLGKIVTATFHLTTVVCSKQTSPVLSIYSNSRIYILELYIHACTDNLYLNHWYNFMDTAQTKTSKMHKLLFNSFPLGQT